MARFYDFLFHVIVPLVIGSIIYLFFRSTPIIAFESIINTTPENNLFPHSKLIQALIGSVPDFCWMYAFLSSQTRTIWNGVNKVPLPILFGIYIIPIFTEYLQKINWIPGTGDWIDVLAYSSAIICNLYFHKLFPLPKRI